MKRGSKVSESVARATGYFPALNVLSTSKNYEGYNDLNAFWIATKQPVTPKYIDLNPDRDVFNLGI